MPVVMQNRPYPNYRTWTDWFDAAIGALPGANYVLSGHLFRFTFCIQRAYVVNWALAIRPVSDEVDSWTVKGMCNSGVTHTTLSNRFRTG